MTKHRFIALVATALFALSLLGAAAPEPASAGPAPSLAYCAGIGTDFPGSLKGAGSLAPDNDIRQQWDWYQRQGYDIVAAGWEGSWTTGAHDVQVKWRYRRANGSYFYFWHICVDSRNHYGSSHPYYWDD